MTKRPKVVIIGSTYIDMAIRCNHFPQAGKSVSGTDLSYTVAGPGPNQAVCAAHCDCDAYLVSKIGGDPFGSLVRDSLIEYKVKTDFLRTAAARKTGTIFTMVDSLGENASCICCGANSALGPMDIEAAESVIGQADICLIHGHLPQDAVICAIKTAEIHGTKVILNPARPITQTTSEIDGPPPAEYFIANCLMANLYEAAQITERGENNLKEAKLIGSDMVARGASCAIITMGKRGCMVVDRDSATHIPAFEIELVDQTCTGDAFAGALAASCASGDDIRKAVVFASAAGALACTKFGCIEALPTKAEIIQLLQTQDIDRRQ
ncbi:MAG: ribokinase [Phycisphaerae bacterium]|nr:ribokinase [Phycisphaerae bacterium]